MRTEAVFRNAVAPVTPAFMPSMVFMLPMLRAMILPNIAVCRVLFVFVRLARVPRPVGRLVMRLLPFSAALVFPLLLVRALFAPLLRRIRLVSVGVLRRRGPSVFLLMLVPLLLLGTSLPFVLVAVLCVGEGSRS